MKLNWLLAFIPIAIALNWYAVDPIIVFFALRKGPVDVVKSSMAGSYSRASCWASRWT